MLAMLFIDGMIFAKKPAQDSEGQGLVLNHRNVVSFPQFLPHTPLARISPEAFVT